MRIREVEDFGAVARQRRRDLGLSQDAVARRAGVTRQWLVRFEQGNSEVSLSKVFAVLGELELAVRTDPVGAARSGATHTLTYTIPKTDVSQFDSAALRRVLERASKISKREIGASARESIRRLNEAKVSQSAATDD